MQNKTNQTKKLDRTMIIAVSVCVGVLAVILFSLIALPRITASVRKNDALKQIEDDGEYRVVLTDPRSGGEGLFSTAEEVLSGDSAAEMRTELVQILKDSRYVESEKAPTGVWLINVTVYTRDGQKTVYLAETGPALVHGDKVTYYRAADDAAYQRLLNGVKDELD